MIKLYLIHQIENENGIETIPHLEAECVENAFEEMRKTYEDDGLFDDMKLFFQPLTITDEELNISPDELLHANKDQQKQIKEITQSIAELNDQYIQIHEDYEKLNKKITRLINERNKEFEDHQLLMQGNLFYRERTKRNLEWCSRADEMKGQIDAYKKKIGPIENQLQEIERARIEKENLRDTIQTQLSNKKTKIDRNLIQLHRGFIMYGPPGIFSSLFYHMFSLISVKFRHRKVSSNESIGEKNRHCNVSSSISIGKSRTFISWSI
jgi:DNA repair exonuclease SbcCD ATPase subunit